MQDGRDRHGPRTICFAPSLCHQAERGSRMDDARARHPYRHRARPELAPRLASSRRSRPQAAISSERKDLAPALACHPIAGYGHWTETIPRYGWHRSRLCWKLASRHRSRRPNERSRRSHCGEGAAAPRPWSNPVSLPLSHHHTSRKLAAALCDGSRQTGLLPLAYPQGGGTVARPMAAAEGDAAS